MRTITDQSSPLRILLTLFSDRPGNVISFFTLKAYAFLMTSYKGLHHALAALQGLDPVAQQKLLENLAKKDPKLAEALKDELFQFEDIAHLSKADFKKLWFEIPKATWLMALRAAPNSVLKFIASGLTQRGYEQLAEDLKTLGPQPLSKVQTAQKELLQEIREMAKQGKISLPTKGAGTKMV